MAVFEKFDNSNSDRRINISASKIAIAFLALCFLIFLLLVLLVHFVINSGKDNYTVGGIAWNFIGKSSSRSLRNKFKEANLNRGLHTYPLPVRLFSNNRRRLCDALREKNVPEKSLVLLEGGKNRNHARYQTHIEISPFRQESYFTWAFGVEEPGFLGAIDIQTCKATLFTQLTSSYWTGISSSVQNVKKKYGVEGVRNATDLREFVNETNPELLLVLVSKHAFSRRVLEHPDNFQQLEDIAEIDNSTLGDVITNLRLIKSELEQDVLRYVANVSIEGHKFLMKSIRPGMYEYQLESLFNHYAYFRRGCRLSAYTGIVGSGPNGAILHYGSAEAPNNRQMRDGDLCLIDMGAEYFCYGADITRTLPVNGKFTEKQKLIYNTVLNASRTAQAATKPGVWWIHLVNLAQKSIIYGLKQGGLLKGDVYAMLDAGIGDIFMPHGLGHQLGLDVHDAEIWHTEILKNATERVSPILGVEKTRIVKAGMYITIEPGCYFVDTLIDKALKNATQSKFMQKSEIEKYRGFGGIRIENDFILTEDGIDNFSSHLPTTVEEIEAFMAEK